MYVTPSMKHEIKCNNFPVISPIWLVLFKSKLLKQYVGIVYNTYYVIVMDGNLKLLHNVKNLNC
jgi:hypothetical protein